MEFIIIETEVFLLNPEIVTAMEKHGKVHRCSYQTDPGGVLRLLESTPVEERILIAPSELSADPELIPAVQKFEAVGRAYWVDPTEPNMAGFAFDDLGLPRLFETLAHSHSAKRTFGIKNFLEKGSVIYGEALFNAGNLGSKLDPAFDFARKRMDNALALRTWATLEAVILTAFQHLPGGGDGTTGERVDVQVGADARTFAMSVRFESRPDSQLLGEPSLRTALEQCHLLEVRHLTEAKKTEVNLAFFLDAPPKSCVRSFVTTGANALEAPEDVKDYVFKSLATAADAEGAEPVRKVKGFKKKFSEQVKVISGGKAEDEPVTVVKAGQEADDFAASLVSGKAEAAPSAAPGMQPIVIQGDKPEAVTLLESKLESAQNTIRQRDELIQKLYKEIEEIKDPLKMNVITNIKDSQKQGLTDNIKRLEAELQEADKREKELMAIADKAVQLRDETIKKVKDLEGKLRMTSGGTNSKVAQLEKQLEESMRQRSLLSKKVDELTQKLGGKAAWRFDSA